MQDITELQRRLTAALDRIGAGLDVLAATSEAYESGAAPVEPVDAEALQSELEAERVVTAQLEERLRANRRKLDTREAELQGQIETLREQLTVMEEDRGRLKAVNDALRDSNQALREANEAGIGDGALVNTAMHTELDALRQVRRSDRAELDAVLGLLAPVLEKANKEAEEDA